MFQAQLNFNDTSAKKSGIKSLSICYVILFQRLFHSATWQLPFPQFSLKLINTMVSSKYPTRTETLCASSIPQTHSGFAMVSSHRIKHISEVSHSPYISPDIFANCYIFFSDYPSELRMMLPFWLCEL